MNRKRLLSLVAMAGASAGVALIGVMTLVALGAPPPLHPHHPPIHAPHHPLVKPVVKPVIVPKAGPVVVQRTGPRVVVKENDVVVREAAPTTIVKVVNDLPKISSVDAAKATAYKVADVGDNYVITILVDGQKTQVRLLGVAPVQTKLAGERGEMFDRQADRFVKNLLIGEWVYLEYDDNVAQEDENGTTVAYVYRAPDMMFVNLELVRQGYGVVASGYTFEEQKLFGTYEDKAQTDNKGVWRIVNAVGPEVRPAEGKPVVPAPKGG
jgi:endonuclease YncB( thermonuclease family)